MLKFKSILVPIDFSKISRKALDYAAPLAKHFGGKITLLHAIEPPPYSADLTYVPMGEGFPIGPTKKELDALAKNTIEPELLKTVLVRVGTAFEVITNVARDCEADLIVTGRSGGLPHRWRIRGLGMICYRIDKWWCLSDPVATRGEHPLDVLGFRVVRGG
jgi:nucleotide-binding universal stress UspA family protein